MKFLQACTVAFLFVFLASCKKQNADVLPANASTTTNSASKYISNGVACDASWGSGNYMGTSDPYNDFSIRYFPQSSCTSGPTPLIIAIHGGGFTAGDKELMLPAKLNKSTNMTNLPPLLTETQLSNEHFAYATINYRYVKAFTSSHLETPLNDCKAFVAYIRNHAAAYNIDPNRIILLGFSAGASASLWVGLQDAGIKGIIALAPQASLDVTRWQSDIFQPFGVNRLADIYNFAFTGYPTMAQFYYGTTNLNQIRQYSDANRLHFPNLMDSSDPELMLATSAVDLNDLLHNAYHVYTLKARAQQAGLAARIAYVRNPYFLNSEAESIIEFCKRKF